MLVEALHEIEPLCRAALAAKEAELAHAEAKLAESEGQVKTLSAKYDRVKQHLEHDEQALAAQRAEYKEAKAAAKEATSSSQAAVARESDRQRKFQEQVTLLASERYFANVCILYSICPASSRTFCHAQWCALLPFSSRQASDFTFC